MYLYSEELEGESDILYSWNFSILMMAPSSPYLSLTRGDTKCYLNASKNGKFIFLVEYSYKKLLASAVQDSVHITDIYSLFLYAPHQSGIIF